LRPLARQGRRLLFSAISPPAKDVGKPGVEMVDHKRQRLLGGVPSLAELAIRACVDAELAHARQMETKAGQRVAAARAVVDKADGAVEAKEEEHRRAMEAVRAAARSASEALDQALAERAQAALAVKEAKVAALVKYHTQPTQEQAAKMNAFAKKLRRMGLEELASGSCGAGAPAVVYCPSVSSAFSPPPARQMKGVACPLCDERLGVGYCVSPKEGGAGDGSDETDDDGIDIDEAHVRQPLGLVCINEHCLGRSTVFAVSDALRIALCAADEGVYRTWPEEVWHSPYPWIRCRGVSWTKWSTATSLGLADGPTELCSNFIILPRPPSDAPRDLQLVLDESLYACRSCMLRANQRTSAPNKSLVTCSERSCSTFAGLHPDILMDLPRMDDTIPAIRDCAGQDCSAMVCKSCCGGASMTGDSMLCAECADESEFEFDDDDDDDDDDDGDDDGEEESEDGDGDGDDDGNDDDDGDFGL